MADKHGPKADKHGHNAKKHGSHDAGSWVAAAQDGWANYQGWVIDFYHVATGKCVNFKSFITTFSDSYSSNWTEEQVYGRMDPIAMFQGTTRKITFGFSVPAESEVDARKNLHKFEHLSTMLYPTYKVADNINTLQGPPLLKIKFTNLISDAVPAPSSPSAFENGLLGFIDGIDMSPDLDLGFFNPEAGVLLPKAFEINCNFTVLHTHDLGFRDGSPNGHWLGQDKKHAKGYPYGMHQITGMKSMCGVKGAGGNLAYSKGKPKNSKIKKAQENKVIG
jgi:hypothetical protein